MRGNLRMGPFRIALTPHFSRRFTHNKVVTYPPLINVTAGVGEGGNPLAVMVAESREKHIVLLIAGGSALVERVMTDDRFPVALVIAHADILLDDILLRAVDIDRISYECREFHLKPPYVFSRCCTR